LATALGGENIHSHRPHSPVPNVAHFFPQEPLPDLPPVGTSNSQDLLSVPGGTWNLPEIAVEDEASIPYPSIMILNTAYKDDQVIFSKGKRRSMQPNRGKNLGKRKNIQAPGRTSKGKSRAMEGELGWEGTGNLRVVSAAERKALNDWFKGAMARDVLTQGVVTLSLDDVRLRCHALLGDDILSLPGEVSILIFQYVSNSLRDL
jgi:hypothetical protein